MSGMADEEKGLKWWLRYVIVPLIGGGGIIAIVVSVLGRKAQIPTTPVPVYQQQSEKLTTASPTSAASNDKPKQDASTANAPDDAESVDFYYMLPGIDSHFKGGLLDLGQHITLVWTISNPKGQLYLITRNAEGQTSREAIEPDGSKAVTSNSRYTSFSIKERSERNYRELKTVSINSESFWGDDH